MDLAAAMEDQLMHARLVNYRVAASALLYPSDRLGSRFPLARASENIGGKIFKQQHVAVLAIKSDRVLD